jgi:hypothetical protein
LIEPRELEAQLGLREKDVDCLDNQVNQLADPPGGMWEHRDDSKVQI